MDTLPTSEYLVDINSGYKKIAVRQGASLLAGLARKGIFVPSACGGNARCGYCKVKVLGGGGGITPKEDPLLSEQDRAAGFRLSCQLKITGDLSIELPQSIFSVQRFTGTVVGKQLLTYDIVRLKIELVKPETLEFTAGQYVQIKSQPYEGKDSVLRDYSIASVPSDRRHIELMVRKVPNGICSTWVFDHLKEGDTVYFSAPYGSFSLSQTSAPVLFIAGGSGMGPIWSMLNDMKEKGVRRTAYYFFGAITRRDLFLVDELARMQQELPGFRFIPALSNEPADSPWKGERGLITDVVARHFPNCAEFEAYLCGSPGMIGACKKVLEKGGMRGDKIYYDKFA